MPTTIFVILKKVFSPIQRAIVRVVLFHHLRLHRIRRTAVMHPTITSAFLPEGTGDVQLARRGAQGASVVPASRVLPRVPKVPNGRMETVVVIASRWLPARRVGLTRYSSAMSPTRMNRVVPARLPSPQLPWIVARSMT